jgi:hypothetical protein
MSDGIYLLRGKDELLEMTERPYDSEDILQALIAKFPNLLAGNQYGTDAPRRWLLTGREAALPDEEDGGGSDAEPLFGPRPDRPRGQPSLRRLSQASTPFVLALPRCGRCTLTPATVPALTGTYPGSQDKNLEPGPGTSGEGSPMDRTRSRIRLYRPGDLDALYWICLLTGDDGQDATPAPGCLGTFS